MKRIVWASTRGDSWTSYSRQPLKCQKLRDLTSQPGPPQHGEGPREPPRQPEEPSHDDPDIGMDIEQMTRLEGAGGTESSTEIGEQSISWKGARSKYWTADFGRNPLWRNGWTSSVQKGSCKKTGEDETELIGSEDVLMTKSPEEPNSSTASSILDKRQHDGEISFHQLSEKDVPLYQEAERLPWTSGSHFDQSKFIHLMRKQRSVSKLPEKNVCTQDLRIEIKTLACWIPQGIHCPDNAQGLVRTDASTVHRTAVSVFLQIVSSMGWCRSLRGVDVSCAYLRGNPREVEEPLFFEPPSRG